MVFLKLLLQIEYLKFEMNKNREASKIDSYQLRKPCI